MNYLTVKREIPEGTFQHFYFFKVIILEEVLYIPIKLLPYWFFIFYLYVIHVVFMSFIVSCHWPSLDRNSLNEAKINRNFWETFTGKKISLSPIIFWTAYYRILPSSQLLLGAVVMPLNLLNMVLNSSDLAFGSLLWDFNQWHPKLDRDT